jgi:tetratricopeptide (TPR) repeat protein
MSLRHLSSHAITIAVNGVSVFLLSAYLGSAGVLAQVEEEEAAAPLEPARADTRELQTFRDAITGAESHNGAYGPMLPEQLISLGLALQKEGRHTEAVAVFKRGSHLARINNGLHSAAQISHIQHKITSHLALGQLDEADEAQARLFRVQRRNLASGELNDEALMQQARWQRQAYDLGVGGEEVRFGRLLNMWDLYRMALTNIIDREGDNSANLLPPLYGMLRAQYLISGHKDRSGSSMMGSETGTRNTQSRFSSYRAKSYDMGRSIIRAIYDIQLPLHGDSGLPTIQSRIMMGDWMLWHDARESAMDAYSLAIGELAGLDDAQLQTEKLLGTPAALPDLDGVRPLPPEVSAEEGNILLEFGVSAGGKVLDLVRLSDTEDENAHSDEALEGQARRLMRSLRRTKFRPQFAEGEAITTEKLVKAYVIAH